MELCMPRALNTTPMLHQRCTYLWRVLISLTKRVRARARSILSLATSERASLSVHHKVHRGAELQGKKQAWESGDAGEAPSRRCKT